MNTTDRKNNNFYFGNFMIIIPIMFFIASIISFVICRRASLKTFLISGFISIFITFIISKDKKHFGKKCIENMKNETLLTCILIFILAGILSNILKMSGISDSLLKFFINIGLSAEFLPAIIFVICCLISTLIGTSTGTISMAVPIFLPLSVTLNCNPALILGAIVCGSFFGDNLSPISDTTIISTNTMKVNIYETLKQRLKISLICAVISTIIFIILGKILITNTIIVIENNNVSLLPLVMLSVFVLMIILLAKKYDLVSVLLLCNVAALSITLIFGFVEFDQIVSQESPIVQGIEDVFGVIMFLIFLSILTEFIPKEMLEKYINNKIEKCSSPFKINLWSMLTIIISILTISNNTAAMSLLSKFIDKCFKNKTQIEKANIFDGLSCAVPSLLPYNTAFMLMTSLAFETGCLAENFSTLQIVMFSINGILLLMAYIFMALYTPKKRTEVNKYQGEQ